MSGGTSEAIVEIGGGVSCVVSHRYIDNHGMATSRPRHYFTSNHTIENERWLQKGGTKKCLIPNCLHICNVLSACEKFDNLMYNGCGSSWSWSSAFWSFVQLDIQRATGQTYHSMAYPSPPPPPLVASRHIMKQPLNKPSLMS